MSTQRSHGSAGTANAAVTGEPEQHHGPSAALAFGALGVVFGDIGTSPLYAIQAVFSIKGVDPVPVDVFGVISLCLWSITIVVSIKYLLMVMRADNDGEGGVMALVSLLRLKLAGTKKAAVALILGMMGLALFYGDSVITPAISVMSAMEGMVVFNADLEQWVVPVSMAILTGLFVIQRWGTEAVGKAFGPVMSVWFVVLGALGIPHILNRPDILQAISPTYAFSFAVAHPLTAFLAMGAVALTITGAEALYADMGHFGITPIRISWFFIVMPALFLNYLGQGALVLRDPSTVVNPFFNMAPDWATLPLIVLAAFATVIASQAVISGAFSASRQAVRIGILPRLTVKHTSKEEGGQIYLPAINWILFVGVVLLIEIFQSSSRLASAYGLAVTGTLILVTSLFLILAQSVWHWAFWKLALVVVIIGSLEIVFFAACLTKLPSGGWLPLVIAAVVVSLMTIWRQGASELHAKRRAMEGPLSEFVEMLRGSGIVRVPGIAVFPHANKNTTPLALRSIVEFNHVVHEHVVIVQIVNENVPHIRHVDRVSVSDLGHADDGIVHIAVRVGFTDSQDVEKGFRLAIGKSEELNIDPDQAHYFLSVLRPNVTARPSLRTIPTRIFAWMVRNEANRVEVFHLPQERTVVMGARIDL